MLAAPAVWGAPGTTFTTSAAEIDTINTTNVTQRVDTFSVELKARMQSGAFLYDQTSHVPFSDPSVQTAITQAQGVLTGVGAHSFTGPTQLSSVQSSVSSVTNVVQTGTQTTQTIVGYKVFVGPLTITVGNLGVCQSYALDVNNYATLTGCPGGTTLPIAAGGVDVDTTTLSLVTISQTATTTNAFLTTQVYELDGFPQSTPPVTPAPPSLLLLFTALAGAVFYLSRRRPRS